MDVRSRRFRLAIRVSIGHDGLMSIGWRKIGCVCVMSSPVFSAPPDGFERTVFDGDFHEIIGMVPMGDGRMLAFERDGLVWVLAEDGEASETPFLDLEEEILGWRDHGLMSVVLDPAFFENGFVYALYAVDPHHLHLFGTPDYNPNETWTDAASIGRLVRYEATAESDYSIVDPSTRHILIGESIDSGIPIVGLHHGLGELHFASDGTLLFSMGDSAGFQSADTGGEVFEGFVAEALAEGIITEAEDVGAFRAQMIDSLCGKMLRVDPATGDGIPSNPFYDPDTPRSARSRVWALGLRNVFRWAFVPGSGSSSPADGNPGVIVGSDSGWDTREETGLIPGAGANLGWPLFEGFDAVAEYWYTDVAHPTAENPLGGDGCSEFFRFRDLLQEEQAGGTVFVNPCHTPWLEAEEAAFNEVDLNTDNGGASGSGGLKFDNRGDEWIEFSIEGDATAPITIGVRYNHSSNSVRRLDLLVDGVLVENLEFTKPPCTGCWVVLPIDLELAKGKHTLRLQQDVSFGLTIDRIEVSTLDSTEIQASMLTFIHQRPFVDWYHTATNRARVAGYADGVPVAIRLSDESCPVEGESFRGICAAGVEVIDDVRWPEEWHGIYFTDIYFQWLRVLQFDDNGELTRIREFDLTAGRIADLEFDVLTGDLLAIQWDGYPLRYSPPVGAPCVGDFTGDGVVNGDDLGLFLVAWDSLGGDLNGDGTTDGADLGIFLLSWGPCP